MLFVHRGITVNYHIFALRKMHQRGILIVIMLGRGLKLEKSGALRSYPFLMLISIRAQQKPGSRNERRDLRGDPRVMRIRIGKYCAYTYSSGFLLFLEGINFSYPSS